MTDRLARNPTKWPVASHRVFRSPWMEVREDDIATADGTGGRFAVITRPDFVVVLCTADGRLVMTEQYRYAAARWSLELPQGGIDPGESVQDAAVRELREETGWRGTKPAVLAPALYEAADWATQRFSVVEMTAMERCEPELERTEYGATTRLVPPAELMELVIRRQICDAATLAALALWQQRNQPGASWVSAGEGLGTCES